jgi:serine/threonine-protein kinase
MQLLGERYRLAKRLGTGGMSVVWRGYDELLGRLVAIKVPAPHLVTEPAYRDRIRHEATVRGRPNHPNVAMVYDYGESPGPDGTSVPYVVLELVEGRSLTDRLAEGPLPWPLAVTVCAEVAAALAAAHELGLVHRDVTPANVLLAPTGAKLIDFGIAATVGDRESRAALLGTPAYLAPERLTDTPVQPPIDVYALGVLLYQALTGVLPWTAQTAAGLLAQQRHARPAPLPPIPGLPAAVIDICGRCLAKTPSQRPTAAQVARQLADTVALRVAVGFPISSPSPSRPAPAPDATQPYPMTQPATRAMPAPRRTRWPRVLLPVAVLLLLVLLGEIGVAVFGRSSNATSDAAPIPPAKKTSTAQPSTAAAPACAVHYHVRTRWNAGFTADVTVTNTGTAALSAWTLSFALPDDQEIGQGWNGSFSQSGDRVSVRDAGFNARLTPGASTTLGFNGRSRARTSEPGAFVLNGVTCAATTD